MKPIAQSGYRQHLSDMFPIKNDLKQGGASSLMIFNFALEYAIRNIRVNQKGLKLNGTNQLLVYVDNFHVLGWSVHTVKINTETLVVACNEIGLAVNADTTKYMVMSRGQNAGRSHNIRIDNNPFERLEQFKYLGITLTNGNSFQEEIKSRLKSGNACYHSVHNLLSSSLLSKNI